MTGLATSPARHWLGSAGLGRAAVFLDRHFAPLFLAPGLFCLVAVIGYPVVWNLIAAFTNASLLYDGWGFVGLDNFRRALSDPAFLTATFRTLVWTIASVALQIILGFVAALCLEKVTHGRALLRMALIVPWAFPAIIMSFVWRFMLDPVYGIVNYVLILAGFLTQPFAWFGETSTAMAALVIMNVWFGFPFMMVTILAGLQTIPKELYESARVDGASPWQEFVYITLPGLKAILGTVATLRTIWVFNNFEFPYLTTGGGPIDATTTLPIYAFKIGWNEYDLGGMAAVCMVMMVLLAAATALYLWLLREEQDA